MDLITVIGWAATIVSVSRSIPQLVRTTRTRDVTGMTPATPGCTAISSLGWMGYALTAGDASLIVTALVSAVGAGILAIVVGRIGGMPQWSQRTILLWGLVLTSVASIGGVGWLGSVLTVAVLVNAAPQIRCVRADPLASGVSAAAWVVAAIEGLLWFAYGLRGGDASIAAWGLAAVMPAIVILWLVLPHRIAWRPGGRPAHATSTVPWLGQSLARIRG